MDDNSKSSFYSQNKSHLPHKQQTSEICSEEIPFRLKSKSSFLQQQQIVEEDQNKNPIKELKYLHRQIDSKMLQLEKLNCQYFANQQKLFFKTFINIMDRMSNQLAQTKQKCQNIDEEIDREQQCVQLRSKLGFYRDQSLIMKQQLEIVQKQLAEIRQRNKQKQNHNKKLLNKLTKQVKKQQKYKHRKYSLQTKLDGFDLSILGLKRTTKNSVKNRCQSAYSYQNINLQVQQQKIYPNKLKRPMTAAVKNQNRSSKTFDMKDFQIQSIKNLNKERGLINKAENTINLNNLRFSISLAPKKPTTLINYRKKYY